MLMTLRLGRPLPRTVLNTLLPRTVLNTASGPPYTLERSLLLFADTKQRVLTAQEYFAFRDDGRCNEYLIRKFVGC